MITKLLQLILNSRPTVEIRVRTLTVTAAANSQGYTLYTHMILKLTRILPVPLTFTFTADIMNDTR